MSKSSVDTRCLLRGVFPASSIQTLSSLLEDTFGAQSEPLHVEDIRLQCTHPIEIPQAQLMVRRNLIGPNIPSFLINNILQRTPMSVRMETWHVSTIKGSHTEFLRSIGMTDVSSKEKEGTRFTFQCFVFDVFYLKGASTEEMIGELQVFCNSQETAIYEAKLLEFAKALSFIVKLSNL
ncbi:hypothetical protein P9112_014234 [Eukaryota sp. TZLM1-RC]